MNKLLLLLACTLHSAYGLFHQVPLKLDALEKRISRDYAIGKIRREYTVVMCDNLYEHFDDKTIKAKMSACEPLLNTCIESNTLPTAEQLVESGLTSEIAQAINYGLTNARISIPLSHEEKIQFMHPDTDPRGKELVERYKRGEIINTVENASQKDRRGAHRGCVTS